MKKLFCILLILCLLCACAKKAPEPAPLPESAGEPAASAEAAPEPEPAPESAQDAAEPPAPDYEHEPGWDPAAPSPDPAPGPEYEPVEMLSTLSDAQRTELNVFLSNFSELNFPNFKRGSFDTVTLVNFAYMHNKINPFGRDRIDVRQYGGESCYSISAADVDACLERFLGVQIDHAAFEMDGHPVGYDGERYYFLAADGEAFNTFSVATAMNRQRPAPC